MRVQTTLTFSAGSMDAMRFYQDELGATVVIAMPRQHGPSFEEGVSTNQGGESNSRNHRSSYAVSISTETSEEAERLFSALAAEGTVTVDTDPTDDAARGTLVDKFGTAWTLLS